MDPCTLKITDIPGILQDRGKIYGDFGDNARVSQELKEVISGDVTNLPYEQREAINLIFTKISRIVTGNFAYIDNWDDIAGYATLIANRLRGNNAAASKKA